MLIGTEIIYSWLFLTYWRITKAEFVLSWLTFLSVIGLCGILPVQVLIPNLDPRCNAFCMQQHFLLVRMGFFSGRTAISEP